MVSGNGGRHIGRCMQDKIGRILGRDVLKHHFQCWVVFNNGDHVPLNKYTLPIKHIHLRVRYFRMQQQG